jgi:hypothetical protein
MRCKLNYEVLKSESHIHLYEPFLSWVEENKGKWLECIYNKSILSPYTIDIWVFVETELIFEEDILKQKLEIICNEM